MVADGLAEAAVRFPRVPIVFSETRPLAQEWTYRFLGAALEHHRDHVGASISAADLPRGRFRRATSADERGCPGVGPSRRAFPWP